MCIYREKGRDRDSKRDRETENHASINKGRLVLERIEEISVRDAHEKRTVICMHEHIKNIVFCMNENMLSKMHKKLT